MKKDLGEFGQAVKSEASNVVSSTGSVLEKTLGVCSLFVLLIFINPKISVFQLNEPDSTASTMKRTFSSFIGMCEEK